MRLNNHFVVIIFGSNIFRRSGIKFCNACKGKRDMEERKALIEYERSLPDEIREELLPDREPGIIIVHRRKRNGWLKRIGVVWKLAALFAVFVAMLLPLSRLASKAPLAEDSTEEHPAPEIPVDSTLGEEPAVSVVAPIEEPIIFNEARITEDLEAMFAEFRENPTVFFRHDEITVAVLHAHTSENVSADMTVLEAGEVLVQLLNSSGIRALHLKEAHDSDGKLGAYDNMLETVRNIKDEYGGLMLIVDLHGNDEGGGVTFNVGVDKSFGWKENLRASYSLLQGFEGVDCGIRLLADDLGQHGGTVTVSVAVGGSSTDAEEGRSFISCLALAIVNMFEENTPG